jgi:DNA invertase Pin-like site-specific DNA recombinase
MSKRVLLYTRVSTNAQTIENQHLELQAITDRLAKPPFSPFH